MQIPFARAIPTLEQPWRGIHLMWTGPAAFLFAPGGWRVERRPAAAFETPERCVEVTQTSLARLRNRLELRLPLGWVRLESGTWDGPEPGPCEIFTLELDRPTAYVRGRYRGRHGLAIGLQRGKAVAFQFLPIAIDGRAFDFGPAVVDRVVVYGLGAQAVRWCVGEPPTWAESTLLADLHLPLREFVPALADDAGELAEAQRRLAPGETIDPVRFRELADLLRVALRGPGARPIDALLRMRGESEEPEQMAALDPLRTFVASPKWRRVLGLGWLDRDPALVPGQAYDYRITGHFPLPERDARVFGFHTVPPGTALPADFRLGDCRIRLAQPTKVEAAPGIPETGERWTTRAGIRLAPPGGLPWFVPGLGDFSAVIDLAVPVTRVVLELEPGHDLRVAGALSGLPLVSTDPVPPGARPLLEFTNPVSRIGLRGRGFLFAVRLPGQDIDRMIPISVVLAGVKFDETPRVAAPADVRIANLQAPFAVATSLAAPIRKLHPIGFDVRWTPVPATGVPFWPKDLAAPVPLDAAMFQVERRIEPDGPWGPVLTGEDNTMFGSRGEPEPDREIFPGVDLMRVFPEEPEPLQATGDFSWPDVFRAPTEEDPSRRAPPPPGSVLRYRVRTLDVIGRPSAAWRESNAARLEKHEPPPQPAAWEEVPADALDDPAPTGVHARVLVRGQELDADDAALLGDSDNAIVLRWGWRQAERTQDPYARHFRVYLAPTFDVIPGDVLSVTDAALPPGDWRVEVRLARAIDADAATGLFLNAGYPFRIVEHGAGDLVQMLVRTRIPQADGTFRRPALGPVSVPLKLAPGMTRPATWAERFVFESGHAQLPIADAERYEVVIRDRLVLTEEHPSDALWVGVTAADAEPYVDDTFPDPGPDGPLPGNESAVVAMLARARRAVRPELVPVPPADAVPRVLAPEPAGAPVRVALDLAAVLPGTGIGAGELVQPERATVAALFDALEVEGEQLVALVVDRRDPSETDRPISLPNAGDQASVVAAVRAGSNLELEDRLAVRLAAIHPYADRIFRAATPSPVPLGTLDETLPPSEERYLYRVRRADVGGRVSRTAVVASVVVRVPSLVPGPVPRRAPRQAEDGPERIRLAVPRDRSVTHLLVFEAPAVPAEPGSPAPGEAEILRVPNRRDVAPAHALRLRLPDGAVLAPAVHPLPPLDETAEGWEIAVDSAGAPGSTMAVRAVTVTADGIPSPVGGPWRLTLPKPALAAPVLDVAADDGTLAFTWTLPDPLITSVWLETRGDEGWERASPTRRPPETSLALRRRATPREFRLVAAAQDGRRAVSNPVTG